MRRALFSLSCMLIVAAGFVFAGTLFSLVFGRVIPATWPACIGSGVLTMVGIYLFFITEEANE